MTVDNARWPQISTWGADGFVIRFADHLDEPANRAALSLRTAIEAAGWDGVDEVTTALATTGLRLSPFADFDKVESQLRDLVASRDWTLEPLPSGRRLYRIPTVYGTDLAPQLSQAAAAAGVTDAEAAAQLSAERVRVITLGFAPGQPYLGTLDTKWDIPRLDKITPQVPAGALVLAIRQFVLFAVANPTGWMHVGQTAVQLFQPDAERAFMLLPGDEVQFPSVSEAEFSRYENDPNGGAQWEDIP